MKKNLLYMFTVLCTLSLFTACSDDDEKGDPNGLGVNKWYSGETLALTYGNTPLLGKTVSFTTQDGKSANIRMEGTFDLVALVEQTLKETKSMATPSIAPGVIPGQLFTNFFNVPLTLSGDKYTFEGTDNSNGVEIKYSGSVQKDKMTMSIDAKMPQNALMGTWNLAAPSLLINWETSATIKVNGAWFGLPPEELEWPVTRLLSMVGPTIINMVSESLQSITFGEDGNITASYKKKGSAGWQTSPINLAQYYVKDNKMYLQLNITQILATVQAGPSKADAALPGWVELLPYLSKYLSEGIPFSCNVADGKAQLTLEKNVIEILVALLNDDAISGRIIEKILQGEENEVAKKAKKEMIVSILSQLPGIMKQTENISITLNLAKQ